MMLKHPLLNSRSFGLAVAGLIAGVALLSACGGGGGSSIPSVASGGSKTAPQGHVGFTFVVPNASNAMKAFRRRPQYISSSTASITVIANPGTSGALTTTATLNLNGTNAAGNATCTPGSGGSSCTVAIGAPGGTDVFEATFYDSNGNPLSTGYTTGVAISATGSNTISLTFTGVPATVTVLFVGATPLPMASATTIPLTVAITDADGNTILTPGNYAYPITLTTSSSTHLTLTYNGTSGLSSVALTTPPTPGGGTTFALTASYDGANQDQFNLGVPYVTASVAPASVTPSPLPAPTIVSAALTLIPLVSPGPVLTKGMVAQATASPLPYGIAYDTQYSEYFVSDYTNNVIYVYNSSLSTLEATIGTGGYGGSTPAPLADGSYTAAGLCEPVGIVYDSDDQNLYSVDYYFGEIRKITPTSATTGTVTSIAGQAVGSETCGGTGRGAGFVDGTGAATEASGGPLFVRPYYIAYDTNNKDLYVSDTGNNAIRQVTTELSAGGVAGVVTTIAGNSLLPPGHAYPTPPANTGDVDGAGANGTGVVATFASPAGIAYDPDNNTLYVNDATNNAVRAVDPGGITVKTFAGCYDDGAAPCTQPTAFANGTGVNSAYFDFSGHGTMLAFDPVTHDLYTADYSNAVYRQITTAASYGAVPAVVTTWVGIEGHAGNVNGLGNASNFSSAWGLVWTSSGLFIATENNNRDLRIIL